MIANNKNILIPLLTSCIAFGLVVFFLGIYFENYDVLFNQSILGTFSYRPYHIWNIDTDFLLYPIICYFQDFFPTISISGITKAIRIYIIIYSIHYLINIIFSGSIRYLIIIVVTIFIGEHLMIANNIRICLLAIVIALMFIGFVDNKSAFEKSIITILIITGLISRFETVVLFSPIFLLFSLIFKNHQLIKPIAAISASGLIALGVHHYCMKYDEINVKNFKKYERSLTDRKDALFNEKISTPEKMTKDELIMMGVGLFIEDNIPFKKEEFNKILKHNSIYGYIFENEQILKIWTQKNIDTVLLIYEKLRFTIVAICFITIILWIKSKKNKRIGIVVWGLFVLIYPFIINILFSTPERLVAPYFSSLLMFLIIFLSITCEKQKMVRHTLYGLLFIGIFHLFISIKSSNENIKSKESESEKVMFSLIQDYESDEIPAINMVYFTEMFPSNIFIKYPRLKVVFINSYAFGRYPHILKYNKDYFGNSFNSIVDRYSFIAQRNKYIYSDEYMMRFIKAYLLKVHGVKLITNEPLMLNNNIGKYKFRLEKAESNFLLLN